MIMKPWKTAAALLAAALAPALGLTSCGDTETEWVTAPTISASQAVVTAPDEGGTVTVGLTITNPVDGATISASPSASWVTVTSCTETSVGLSATENPNADPRTARVTVSYPYSVAGTKGTASCEITVAQSCGDQPAISVQPTAVAAAVEGGPYSFEYTIVNPATDGEVSASCSASWITDLDASKDGEVGFEVSENPTTSLRQAEITLSYSWANGSLSESVTVVQDHQGGSGNDDGDGGDFDGTIESLVGTYTAGGYAYYDSGVAAYTTWTLTIYKTGDNEVTIDGLTPDSEGYYPGTSAYAAKASLNSAGQLVIPTQYTGYTHTSTGCYIGWTPCTKYDASDGWYYSKNWPDCTVTYDPSTGVWTSDYGMFLALLTTSSLSTAEFGGFFDVTNPGFQFTKSGELGDGGGDGGDGGGGDYPNYSDMTGTYSCTGYGRVSGGYDYATWDMYITPKSDTEYYVYCLTPYAGGLDIADAGEEYWAVAHWGTETTFVVPSQVCTGRVNSSSGATYYWGYTPCVEYDGSQWYYSSNWPDLTFTSKGGDTWESDYGVFAAGCTDYDITTFTSYFGVTAPTVTITKTSDTVPEPEPEAAANSGRALSAETFPNLKASSEPAHSSGIRSRRAGARAAR